MKKILIIMPSMFIGGAERSLIGFLENIDYSALDVSLFLYRHEGEFLKYVPDEVHILPEIEAYRTFDTPIKSLLGSSKAISGVSRIASKLIKRVHAKLSHEVSGVWMEMQYTSAFLQPLLPPIPGKYDLGIMYLGVADTLINKVDAKMKIAWCHTDYDSLFPDKRRDRNIYSKLNNIVCVSEACRSKLLGYYPELSQRVIVIENCLALRTMQHQASDEVFDMPRIKGVFNLLSIGRFSEAKNFDNIPEICSIIIRKGIAVKWYLIGYGTDEKLISSKIKQFQMEENVIILGKRENPYPYLRKCDLYIQPSRYEGKCVSVIEAQALSRPVVISNYETAKDQLINGVDGIIAPQSNEGCATTIIRLLSNPHEIVNLENNCKKTDYSNRNQLEKIYKILNI